jgi:Na+/H+ antiporter NhaC
MKRSIRTFKTDKEGQTGGISTFFVAVILFGFVYIILGFLMDRVADESNKLAGSFPQSVEYVGSLALIFDYWAVLPIIVFLLLCVWLIKNALRVRTGDI